MITIEPVRAAVHVFIVIILASIIIQLTSYYYFYLVFKMFAIILLFIFFYFFKKDQIQDCVAAMRAERMRRTTDNDSLFSCGGLSSSDRCKGLNVASGTTVCCLRPSCQQHTTQRVRICIYPSVIIVINTIRSSSIQRS